MEFVIIKDSESELQHHGTKGMRWGVRRYQNKDGSLTPLGEKHRSLGQRVHDYKVKRKRIKNLKKAREVREANKTAAAEEAKKAAERAKKIEAGKIPAKKMTSAEIQARIDRLNLEKRYAEVLKETRTKRFEKGKSFVGKVLDKSGENLATQVLNHFGAKGLNKLINETDKDGNVIDVIFANNKKKS